MNTLFKVVLTLILACNVLWATPTSSSWFSLSADKNATLEVKLFLSSTCPHCHKADEFFQKIAPENPWLHLERYVINENKDALIYFNQLLKGSANFSVPSIFFCNSHWVGFSDFESTGKDLLKALNYCKAQIEQTGELTENTVAMLKRWANASLYGTSLVGNPSITYYLVGMALTDALLPCALFSLMAFWAMLFVQPDKKRLWIAGLLFLLGLGLVHYLQQVFSSFFFEWLVWLRIPAALCGLWIAYCAYQSFKTKYIPSTFFLIAFLLALFTQSYQQTCLMNWSYVFEQWVHNQPFSSNQIRFYQGLYQLMYLFIPFLFLITYGLLSTTKRFDNYKPQLTRLGLLVTAAIALLLIVYPYALSYFLLSLVIWVGLVIVVIWKRDNNYG